MLEEIKKYYVKYFFYNLVIILNVFIILTLIYYNFFTPFSVKKPTQSKISPIQNGSLKLIWQSKNEFQNIDKNIFFMDQIKSPKDTIKNLVCVSTQGNIFILKGASGKILNQMSIGPTHVPCHIFKNKIIAGNDKGDLFLFDSSGKLMTKHSFEKTKVITVLRNFVALNQRLLLINPNNLEVNKNYFALSNQLIKNIDIEKFNDDSSDDVLLCTSNSIHCLDGITLNQLWEKPITSSYSGYMNTLRDKEDRVYVILPLVQGSIKIINEYGNDVWEIKLDAPSIRQPIVYENQHHCFLQITTNQYVYAFDFEQRKNIWSIIFQDRIMDVRIAEALNDNNPIIFIITENGQIHLIDSNNGHTLMQQSLVAWEGEKVYSNLLLTDINNDDFMELAFSTDKGNVYLYQLVQLNNKLKLKKLIRLFQ